MATIGGSSLASAQVFVPNETLDQAVDLGDASIGSQLEEQGSLGKGPAGAADVEWYSFSLDQPARIVTNLTAAPNGSSFQGVLSLFNNDPWDFGDPMDVDGHRLLEQVQAQSPGGNATIDQLLGPATYYLAVSGAGNLDFHPLLANSGLPGSTGQFDLQFSVADAGIPANNGPSVLSSDPSPGDILNSSPLVIRIEMSGALDPSTIQDGQTVQLTYNPNGTFGDQNDVPIALGSTNFSTSANELQLILAAPLSTGYYKLWLAGDSSAGQSVVAAPDGTPLGMDDQHPLGQDYTFTFQVAGIEGGSTSDDTAATAHSLGDITAAGIVRVPGTIGNDPYYSVNQGSNPGNAVNMYHFHISGTGSYAFVAEVFAGRIGSPLDPGISLWGVNPTDHSLYFIDGDNNTYDPIQTHDHNFTPLYTDCAIYDVLTAGDYYVAVADGMNTPSPRESQPLGSPGLLDPNVSHSAQNGFSTGPYVLDLLVHDAPDPPQVVATNPTNGETLDAPPTEIAVKFDEPMNVAILAFQTFQKSSQNTISSIFIVGQDGTKYFPLFESYDSVSDQASFMMPKGLPNGDYELHFSGANGLHDLAGNPLVGNDPSGDYVVHFTVDGPARGVDGNPLEWNTQGSHDDIQNPQDLGVLFPADLASKVTISRNPQTDSQGAQDTADVYRFQVLQSREYTITLSGNDLPANMVMTLMDSSGKPVSVNSANNSQSQVLLGNLAAGTYLLSVSGWTAAQGAELSYKIALTIISQYDNAPPLVTGPQPAIAVLLDASPTPSPSPAPPPVVVAPPVLVGPAPILSSSDGDPAAGGTSTSTNPGTAGKSLSPSNTPIEFLIQPQGGASFPGSISTDLVALSTGSMGGVTGSQGFGEASMQLAANASAVARSSVTSGLIATATSFHLLSLPEVPERATPEVSAASLTLGTQEQPVASAEATVIDAALSGLGQNVQSLMASIGNLFERFEVSEFVASHSDATLASAGTGPDGVTGRTALISPVSTAREESYGAEGTWERTWAFVLITTSLVTEACARWQGGRLLLYGKEGSGRVCVHSGNDPSTGPPRTMIPRLFHTCFRTVKRHASWNDLARIAARE
ncbi:MAG: Ig-like domain-containing protein [Isosphaeraceae bacterium]